MGDNAFFQKNKSVENYAMYLQSESKYNSISIVAGLRYNYNSKFESNVSPSISFRQNFNDLLNFRLGYSRGYKTPLLKHLYYDYLSSKGTHIVGNTNLKPQTSDYYSVSLEYYDSKINFSVNGYYNKLKDLIGYKYFSGDDLNDEDKALNAKKRDGISEFF